MRIKESKVYEFDELSQGLKDKVIEKLWDINVDHDWWDAIADDAKQIGCDIREFDIYGRTCYLVLDESPECVAKLILTNHGKHCDTYKVAKSFLKDYTEDDENIHNLLRIYRFNKVLSEMLRMRGLFDQRNNG